MDAEDICKDSDSSDGKEFILDDNESDSGTSGVSGACSVGAEASPVSANRHPLYCMKADSGIECDSKQDQDDLYEDDEAYSSVFDEQTSKNEECEGRAYSTSETDANNESFDRDTPSTPVKECQSLRSPQSSFDDECVDSISMCSSRSYSSHGSASSGSVLAPTLAGETESTNKSSCGCGDSSCPVVPGEDKSRCVTASSLGAYSAKAIDQAGATNVTENFNTSENSLESSALTDETLSDDFEHIDEDIIIIRYITRL